MRRRRRVFGGGGAAQSEEAPPTSHPRHDRGELPIITLKLVSPFEEVSKVGLVKEKSKSEVKK